ncbi:MULTISPECIES: hypothetical protein [Photorhabdus]|uniref:Uncharacterized protein n=2 Tax=Photorhabdus asymbiotica TaxID=291112 RepID=C7BLN6_PHOAA|nr:hypothetical protein [Photorhabdus asymbiotica]RKS57161.1 hypothetical protein BDD30_3802 [Photorhabdus asymbiotica]CAQ84483.1 hypothetical protein PAU_02391 [Photorhabdus asymbiotica]
MNLYKYIRHFLTDYSFQDLTVGEIELSSINRCWKISHVEGCWLLKQCNNDYTDDWLALVNKLIPELKRYGLENLLECSELGYFIGGDGVYWTLSKYLENATSPSLNCAETVQKATTYLKNMQAINISNYSDYLSLEIGRNDLRTVLQNGQNLIHFYSSLDDEYFIRSSVYKCEFISALKNIDFAGTLAAYNSLDLFISHGEYQIQNILEYRGSWNPVDWDNLHLRSRIVDVLTTVAYFCRIERGGFKLNRSLVVSVIRSFNLNQKELNLLPSLSFLYFVPSPYLFDKFYRLNPSGLNWYLPWGIKAAYQLKCQLHQIINNYQNE